MMRATYHCGRGKASSTKHNDRNFDMNLAPHINQELTSENITAHIFQKQHPEWTFEQAELEYYRRRYGKALEAQNQRYKEQSKEKYCKDMEQVYRGKKTRPDEVVMQIGNKDEHPDSKILKKCWVAFDKKFRKWNNEHGNHVHNISVALHMDESTPHFQIKRVFDYKDKDGNIRIGQNKGLEQAGIPLPDPGKAPGQRNNRKMVFDAMMRDMWVETLREYGLQIETDPLPSHRHLDTESYIDQQINLKTERLESLEKSIGSMEKSIKSLEKTIEELQGVKESLTVSVTKLKADQLEYEKKKAKWDNRFGDVGDLVVSHQRSNRGPER